MRYLGGKARTWKEIAKYLESMRQPEQEYLEPFVGGSWVLQGMSGKRIASDANESLINMYIALQNGWVPPSVITNEIYQSLKATQDPTNPLTAFVGFGVSFGGKWFGGFANSSDRNYASNAKNSLLKKLQAIEEVEFKHCSYLDYSPENLLIYCDPPYANTTGYSGVGQFDSVLFWDTMRQWSNNNTVVISEYVAPDDFICVKEMHTKTDMHTNSGKETRVEKLFMYNKC